MTGVPSAEFDSFRSRHFLELTLSSLYPELSIVHNQQRWGTGNDDRKQCPGRLEVAYR